MLLPHLPMLCCSLCQIRRFPSRSHLVRSSQSCQSFSRYFRFIGFPDGDMRCPLVLSYFADEPCQSPLLSSYLFNHIKDLYLLSFPDVYFLSRFVMFIFVCAGANLFFAWVVSANVSVIFHHHLCLQLVFTLIPVAFVVHSSYSVFKRI